MTDQNKLIMALQRTALDELRRALLEATGTHFNVILMTCAQGSNEVRMSECTEHEIVRKGMAVVLAKEAFPDSLVLDETAE